MSWIGWAYFDTIRGEAQEASVVVDPFLYPGLRGVGFQKSGYRGHPFRVYGEARYPSSDFREAMIKYCNELKGQDVSVVDDQGTTWTGLVVLDFKLQTQFVTENSWSNGLAHNLWFGGVFTLMATG